MQIMTPPIDRAPETTESLFVVDDLNIPFVQGEAERPPDHLIGVVALVVAFFVMPMIGLNLVVIAAWGNSDGVFSASLALITSVTLAVDGIILAAAAWFTRRFRLQRRGQLIRGNLQQLDTQVRPGPQGSVFVVTVQYTFTSPRTGREIQGVIAQNRNDLIETRLPEPGAPVAVLYRNDRNYRVM